MKKSLYLILLMLAVLSLSSCILTTPVEKFKAKDFHEYLNHIYGEEIEIKGQIEPEEWQLTEYDKDYHTFYNCYSPVLKKEFLVAVSQWVKESSEITDSIGIYSSYNYVKVEDIYTEKIENLVKNDFSDIKIVFDFKDILDQANYEYLERLILTKSFFILIHANSEESAELEDRIKSSAYNLHSNGYIATKYFYITTPDSEEIDFSEVDFASLKDDTELNEKFAKRYKLKLTYKDDD